MRVSWKRIGMVIGVATVLAFGLRAYGTQPYKQQVEKCNPNKCGPEDFCGTTQQVPKRCGETRDGPFFEATYACCCCTPESKGRWFFGE